MMPFTLRGSCASALLALQLCAWPAAHAASEIFRDELDKQEGIYKSKGADTPDGYVIDRSLLSYTYTLPEAFNRSLGALSKKDRWLDIGAGEGRAVIDYCTSKYDALHAQDDGGDGGKAQAVAISIEDRRTHRWHEAAASLQPDRMRYLYGRRFGEYSRDELGRFNVITDVMGGFSYTTDVSLFMQKALALLEVSGSYYTVLADVHSEEGGNKPHYADSPYLTEITTSDGKPVKVCSWLKQISCVEVTCEFKANWTPPIEVYQIRKTCDDVRVPALVPVHYAAGTPPERGFRLRDAWLTEPRKVAEPEPTTVQAKGAIAPK